MAGEWISRQFSTILNLFDISRAVSRVVLEIKIGGSNRSQEFK